MRGKKEIVAKLAQAMGEAPEGFHTAVGLLPILEVLTDIRDLLVTMEGSTEHYRGVDIKYREMELNKR